MNKISKKRTQVIILKGLKEKPGIYEIQPGYARYLIRTAQAKPATPAHIAWWEEYKAKALQQYDEYCQQLQGLIDRIKNTKCVLQAHADKDGKLYGSIQNKQILAKLNQSHPNTVLQAAHIKMMPIKTVGEHSISIEPTQTLQTNLSVIVKPLLK